MFIRYHNIVDVWKICGHLCCAKVAGPGQSVTAEKQEIKRLVQLVSDKAELPRAVANIHRRCLADLAEGPRTAEELAKALGTSTNNVRGVLNKLRGAVSEFFSGARDGQSCGYRLEIQQEKRGIKGQSQPYHLRLERNPFPVHQFWAPYVDGNDSQPAVILCTEPLVFYDPEMRCYVRFLHINADSDPAQILESLPEDHPVKTRGMIPCFGYQSSGDIEATYHLERSLLKALGIESARRLTRHATRDDIFGQNVVVVGNKRMNPYVGHLQDGLELTVEERSVKEQTVGVEHEDYVPKAAKRGAGIDKAYAVLTRRPNLHHNRVVTMIAGNHGRAIEKVAEYVTDPLAMEQLWARREFAGLFEWPKRFQVLFEIEVSQEPPGVVYQQAKAVHVHVA